MNLKALLFQRPNGIREVVFADYDTGRHYCPYVGLVRTTISDEEGTLLKEKSITVQDVKKFYEVFDLYTDLVIYLDNCSDVVFDLVEPFPRTLDFLLMLDEASHKIVGRLRTVLERNLLRLYFFRWLFALLKIITFK